MMKRTLLTLATTALLIPSLTFADDSSTPAPAPTSSTTPAQDQGTATSSGLGPQSTGTAGGSNADSAALQPAGNAPLQSTTGDSTGLSAPSSVLQAPATGSNNLQVLSGEADGAPHQTGDTAMSLWGWLTATFVLALMLAGLYFVLRDRRRFAQASL